MANGNPNPATGVLQKRIYDPREINLSLENTNDLGTYVKQELNLVADALESVMNRFNQLVPEIWTIPQGQQLSMPNSGVWYRMEVTELLNSRRAPLGVYNPNTHTLRFERVGIVTISASAYYGADTGATATGLAAMTLHPDPNATPLSDLYAYDAQYANFGLGQGVTMDVTFGVTNPPLDLYVLMSHTSNRPLFVNLPLLSISYIK